MDRSVLEPHVPVHSEKVTSGEISATADGFPSFYEREYEPLVRALFLLTGDPAEAEELAQEAFVRVLERWQRVEAMDSSTGYLYRIALNLNRRRLRSAVLHGRRWFGMPRTSADPSAVVEARGRVRQALSALAPSLREVLILADWLELDQHDMSRVLRTSPGAVRVRLHRARSAFRKEWEEQSHE